MLDKSFYYDFEVEFNKEDINSIVDFFVFLDKKNIEYKTEEDYIFHLFVPNVVNRSNKEINVILQKINKLTKEKYYKRTENPIKLNKNIFVKINNEKYYRIKKECFSEGFLSSKIDKERDSIKLKRLETHYKYIELNWRFCTINYLDCLRDALKLGVFYNFPTIEYRLFKLLY